MTAAKMDPMPMSRIITPTPEKNSDPNRAPIMMTRGPLASGTSASGAGNSTQPATKVQPTPSLRASRRVTSAPSTPPTAPAPRMTPSTPGRTWRYLVEYTANRVTKTKLKKLMNAAAPRLARTTRECAMNRTPALREPWLSGSPGSSAGRIRLRKNAEPR